MFAAKALLILASVWTAGDQPTETVAVSETAANEAAFEAAIPAEFTLVGATAEEQAAFNESAGCRPRTVVNSVPDLRACVIAGKIPGCEYDFEAEDVSFCPDGSKRFRVIIYNDCPGSPNVPIAEIFVCNCTVESWSCL